MTDNDKHGRIIDSRFQAARWLKNRHLQTIFPSLPLPRAPRPTLTRRPLDLPDGTNLAAALLAVGVQVFRHTPVSGAPRAPFCMMGACFDCLVEVDGVVRQACMLEVAAGMKLSRPHQDGAENAAQ